MSVDDEVDFTTLALFRDSKRNPMPSGYTVLREKDILNIEADAENIQKLMDITGLELAPDAEHHERTEDEIPELELVEVIVTEGSPLIGHTANRLALRDNDHVNVLAIARDGARLRQRLDKIRFRAGDILLVQAKEESMAEDFSRLGCLPLASRGLRIGKPRKVLLATGIFVLTLSAIAANLVPSAVGMVAGAVAMVLAGLVNPSEIYGSLDMPVIVLLAAMLPVGEALEQTGGSSLIAGGMLELGASFSPAVMLAVLMGGIMLVSNVLNNAAAAILAGPIAVNLAQGMQVAPEPFLMAVVIGASCAFLTPIGHQANTLVMIPGGYKFGDYWKLGLPLSLIVIACSVPAILFFWPL